MKLAIELMTVRGRLPILFVSYEPGDEPLRRGEVFTFKGVTYQIDGISWREERPQDVCLELRQIK